MRWMVPGATCGVAAALLLTGACTSADTSNRAESASPAIPTLSLPPPSTPLPSPSTSHPVASGSGTPQEPALTAYRQMWAVMVQAAVTPDPGNPKLADYATGAALQKLQYSLSVDRENGFTSKGTLHFSPRVTSASGSFAEIEDCTDDSEWLKYKADGTLKGDAPGGRRHVEATAALVGATWKVTDFRVGGVGTC